MRARVEPRNQGAQVHHHGPGNQGAHVHVQQHHHGHHGRYHRHYYGSRGWGSGALLIGSMFLVPIILIALILQLTVGAVNVAATSMAATGLVGAGVGVGSTLAFSTALGVGALAVYGALGLAFLYSSAKECYSGNKNVFDVIKSRVVNEDGLSFIGVVKSIGAVLWSPFLLIGGLAGMGVKAAVQACRSKSDSSMDDVELQDIKTSHSQMKDLGPRKTNDTSLGQQPLQTDSLFYDPSSEKLTDGLEHTHPQLTCN